MKPSPSRWRFWHKFDEANNLIKGYVADKPKVAYVDIASAMINDEGIPDKNIFTRDSLHMNKKGYYIWKYIIKPHVNNIFYSQE